MDKRTIIAFLLIGALLVLTQTTWYKKKVLGVKEIPKKQLVLQDSTNIGEKDSVAVQKEKETKTEAKQIARQEPTKQKTHPEKNESLSSFDNLATASTGEEIYVNTGKYEAILNTKGATISSWKLKDYFYEDDIPVQLIKDNGYGNLGVQFAVDQDTIETENYNFHVNKTSIDLTSGKAADILVFELKDDNRSLKKTFTFYNDKYIFDLKIELTNLGEIIDDQKYTLTWLSGLKYTEKNINEDIRNSKSYIYTGGGKEELKLPEKPNVSESTNKIEGKIDWVAIRTKYFASIIFPEA